MIQKKRINNDVFVRWGVFTPEGLPVDLTNVTSITVEARPQASNGRYPMVSEVVDNFVEAYFLAKDQKVVGKYNLYLTYTIDDPNIIGGVATYTIDYCDAFELLPKSCFVDGEDDVDPVNIQGIIASFTYSMLTEEEKNDLASRISGNSGAQNLSDLLDVTISNLEIDQILKYDGTKWVNVAPTEGSSSNVSWGIPTSQYTPLTVNGVTRNLSLNNHTHSWDTITNRPLTDEQFQDLLEIAGLWKLDNDGNLYTERNLYSHGGISAYNWGDSPAPPVGVYNLKDLLDVGIINPQEDNILRFNGSHWVNVPSSNVGTLVEWSSETDNYVNLLVGDSSKSISLHGHKHEIEDINNLQDSLDFKQDSIPLGDISQYYRGDKEWATLNTDIVVESTNLYYTPERVIELTGGLYAQKDHTHAFNSLTGLPNTLDGYGIIDAYNKTEIDNLISSTSGFWVKSVGLEAPTGFTVSNSPIIYEGNIKLSFASGYSLPSNSKQYNWDLAFADRHTHTNINVLNELTIDDVNNWNSIQEHVNDYNNPHKVSFKQLINKPSTLLGYGITDVYSKTEVDYIFNNITPGESIIKYVYGYDSIDQSFSNDTLSDTFNAYTISRLHDRLTILEQRDPNQGDPNLDTIINWYNNIGKYWLLDADNDALYTTKNVYSTKGVSALGLGDDGGGTGGGGTSYDRLDKWVDYDSSKEGWVLSAFLGKDLDTRVNALNSSLTTHAGNSTIHITATERINWNDANSKKHTHSNKALLDQITQSNIDVLAKLSIVDGNIKVDTTLWATGGISALGLGEDGGSGGAGALSELVDTSVDSRMPGDILVYNGTHWENRPQSSIVTPSLELGETSSTAYRGDRGKIAYEHSQAEHQAIINGTGFVKANGKTLSYDNTTYEPAFSKNTAFNKNFGTTAGTVAQGNDSRIINGQTAYGWGDHASAGYALNSALTAHINKVDNPHAVTKAQVGLGNVDNVKQATKTEFDTHTGNTTVHITSTERTNWNLAYTNNHTHGNKSVIDALTQGHINVLNKLSLDAQGNVKVDATLWATGGISALGLGDGGSSGGGVDMLDSWANYTSEKANYYVPASLLVTFRSDTLGRLTSLENGSATSFDITGSGNAITSVSKSGNTLTFTKGSTFSLSTHNHDTVYKPIGYVPSWGEITGKPSTFAPSSHTHTIANVTGLQTALDGKSSTGHTHPISSITDLQATLNGKASLRTRSSMSDSYRRFVIGVIRLDGGANAYSRAFGTITLSRVNGLYSSKRFDFSIQKKYSLEAFQGRVFRYNSFDTFRLCKFLYNGVLYGGFDIYVSNANITYIDFIGQSPDWVVVEYYNTQSNAVINSEIYNSLAEMDYEAGSFYANGDTIYTSGNLTSLSQLTDNIGVATHIANTSNPHNVTKAQVGLGNVDNTADSAKNVLSATKLTTARTINGTSFDGSANITTANWGTARNIGIVNSDGTGTAVTTSVDGSANVNLKLPSTIKASLTGNASSATYASAVTLTADNSSNATRYPLFVSAATGNLSPCTDTGFTYNPSTGALTANTFIGDLTGNVTGGVTTNNGIEYLYTLSTSISAAGWYRVFVSNASNAYGSSVILNVNRAYSVTNNESYTFSINVAYSGAISITQLSGRAQTRAISKIRVDYVNSGVLAVDIYYNLNNSNSVRISGSGTGKFQAPALVTEPTGTTVEFDTVNGVKSNLGFTGDLTGNASTATKLQNARTIAGVSFDGSANIDIPFANLSSKPTTLAGYGITDGALKSLTLTAGNGLTGGGTLEANRTFALGTPSTLTVASTNAVTSTSHTHAITTTTVGAANTIVATDASGAVRGNIIRIGGNWTLELSGTELVFKYNGVIKQRMLSDGTILATGGVTALATS